MLLKVVRVIQWLIGAVLLVFGIYLIFGIQEFFGTLAIIAAFFIFPNLDKGVSSTELSHDYENNLSDSDTAPGTERSSWSGDSDGGVVQKDRQH